MGVPEPEGDRIRLHPPPSRRPAPRSAAGKDGRVDRRKVDERAGGDGGHLQASPREPAGARPGRRGLPLVLARMIAAATSSFLASLVDYAGLFPPASLG